MGQISPRPMSLRLSDFDYALPAELIAQVPARERTASRLLHVAGGSLRDLRFADLPSLLAPGDLVVCNDTRVINARIAGVKPTGGRVEMLIERIVADDEAWVQLRASHLPKVGGVVTLAGGATAIVRERADRLFRVAFAGTGPLLAWLENHGAVPLPPYITRAADAADASRYQTVYARVPGAVAAPTAGLHFDAPLLAALSQRGVATTFVTLHVGAGTFQPVRSDDLSAHVMHSERYRVGADAVAAIARTRARGGRVVAVGTTSLRALESQALASSISATDGTLAPGSGETTLFITPGFEFRVVDLLLTNFHLPKSTLLMLVSAFAGHERVLALYAHAIAERYRFFSYGDAMLLGRAA